MAFPTRRKYIGHRAPIDVKLTRHRIAPAGKFLQLDVLVKATYVPDLDPSALPIGSRSEHPIPTPVGGRPHRWFRAGAPFGAEPGIARLTIAGAMQGRMHFYSCTGFILVHALEPQRLLGYPSRGRDHMDKPAGNGRLHGRLPPP
jgi:hypothetical protein